MARLVAAFGASHSLMLVSELEDWVSRFVERDRKLPYFDKAGGPLSYDEVLARAPANAAELMSREAVTERFNETQRAMDRLGEEILSARLDALVVVGDDQEELFDETNMPAVAVYWGEAIRNAPKPETPSGDWLKRATDKRLEDGGEFHYPCHAGLARHLIEGLVARDFDPSAVRTLATGTAEGHMLSFIHRRILDGRTVPVVPVFLNTYYPPNQPTPKRCLALGRALKQAIASHPEDLRVGVLASGGLSHFRVEEALDAAVIDAIRKKDLAFLGDLDPRRLQAGSSEIRNWICVAAAAADLELGWVAYIPGYRTPALTGIGICFARWG